MSKKSNLYLKILVLLTLIMEFNCQDCFNHSAFKTYCHEDEKVAKSISFMHEKEVYCQCNGPRFGCEPNKACSVNAYIYSPSSEITLKLTMIDENGEAYKIALPGSLMLDIWWQYKFFAMDDEPLNTVEPSYYAYCYIMMDELKARFKALRNKEIINTTPPEEFELSCNSQDIVKIMLYKSNINKYVNVIHKDHIIEVWEDGNITQKKEELEKILEVSIQHFPRITYYISNNLEPKHIIFNSLSNDTSFEKSKVPCTATNCDVPMKFKEVEEAVATNKKGLLVNYISHVTKSTSGSVAKSNSKMFSIFGLVLLTQRISMLL
uniref:Uncharacterized protein n=1 Tax=Acrobeloides nanus TaxID=290746 RepID=A0A914CW11_9BILA